MVRRFFGGCGGNLGFPQHSSSGKLGRKDVKNSHFQDGGIEKDRFDVTWYVGEPLACGERLLSTTGPQQLLRLNLGRCRLTVRCGMQNLDLEGKRRYTPQP